jgi:hypothetical protein
LLGARLPHQAMERLAQYMALAGIRLRAIHGEDQVVDDGFSGASRHSHFLLISDVQLLLFVHADYLS